MPANLCNEEGKKRLLISRVKTTVSNTIVDIVSHSNAEEMNEIELEEK